MAALRFRLRLCHLLACLALLSGLYGTATVGAASAPVASAAVDHANGPVVVHARAHVVDTLPPALRAPAGTAARAHRARGANLRLAARSGLARRRHSAAPRPVRIVRVHNRYLPVAASHMTPVRLDRTAPVRLDRTAPVRLDRTAPVRLDRTAPVRLDRTAPVRLDRTAPVRLDRVGWLLRRARPLHSSVHAARHTLGRTPLTRLLYHVQRTHLTVQSGVGPRITCPTDVWEGPPFLNRYDNYVDNGHGVCVYSSTSIHATTIDSLTLSGVNFMESNLSFVGTVTLAPGMTLQVSGGGELDVEGTLNATSVTSTITIGTGGGPNSWGGVAFWPGSSGTLDNVHISAAGAGMHDAPGGSCCPHADVVINNAAVSISNSTIDFSSNNGVEVEGGANPTFQSDAFNNNGTWGLHYDFVPASLTFVNTNLSASGNGNGNVVDVVPGGIARQWTISNAGLPLHVGGILGVNAGAELDVNAPTTLLIGNELDIAGTFNATGTVSQPISLTAASGQAPNSWGGLAFWPGSAGTLNRVHISFAGAGLHDAPGGSCCPHADIVVNNANPTITNSTIDFSSNEGIEVEGGANPTLTNDNLLTNGTWGLHYDFMPSIAFNNNGLVASGNGSGDVVDIASGSVTATLSDNNPGPPIRFDGPVGVNAGAEFDIAAGMTVYFNGEVDVAGTFNANGTASQPVSLTTTSGQVPNSWGGVAFWPQSAGTLNDAHISFAGAGLHDAPGGSCCPHADIVVNNANPTISNSTIDTSSNNGIEVEGGANPVLTNDSMLNNGAWPLRYDFMPSIAFDNNGLSASGNGSGDEISLAPGTVSGTLTDNNPGLPLRVNGNLYVDVGAQLNVVAGMLLYINGELDIAGTFDATGTATSPISLTTTNGQTPNSWAGLAFWPGSAGSIDHLHISFAGSGLHDAPGGSCCPHADIVINAANPSITNSTIDTSSNNGIEVEGGADPTLTNDSLLNNGGWPLHYDFTPSIALVSIGLTASGNGNGDVIDLAGGSVAGTLTVDDPGLPVRTDSTLGINSGATFNIAAGMTIYLANELDVAGTLNVTGTASQPVTLTTTSANPRPNSWAGLAFWPGSTGTMIHLHISYAGSGLHDAPGGSCCPHADIVVNNAAVTITNSTIDYSSNNGIEVEGGANPTLTNDNLHNNGTWPLHYDFTPSIALVNNGLVASGNGSGDVVDIASGNVTGTLTLNNPGPPVRFDSSIGVNGGATLNIAAGMLVYFNGEVDVAGTLNVLGSATSPVSLTTTSGQSPNSWAGIAFWPGSGGVVNFAHLSFAGSGIHDAPGGSCCPHADITVNAANPTIANSTIDYSSNNGIEVEGGANPILSKDVLSNNGGWPLRYDYTPSIALVNNGLTASNNGAGNFIDVASGSITGTLTDSNPGLPLRFDSTLSIAAGGTFNVAAGMTVYFNGEVDVAGAFNASGTGSAPISLTTTSGQAPNSWGGIAFWPQSSGKLSGVHLSFAGAGLHDAPGGSCCPHADLIINDAAVTMTGSTIDQSSNNDVLVEANNVIAGEQAVLHADTFGAVSNGSFGVVNSTPGSGSPVNATYNWWGDASGPAGAGAGSGVPVSTGVLFTPFLLAPPPTVHLALSPASATPFQSVAVTGTNFGPHEAVKLYWDSTATTALTTTNTNASGSFVTRVTVPQTPAGAHSVIAVGQGSVLVAAAGVTVKPLTVLAHGSGHQGSANGVSGFGFAANETVTAYWLPGNLVLGHGTTNSVGSVTSLTFTVPLSPTGTYYVYSVGQKSKAAAFSAFTLTPALTIKPTSGARGAHATVIGSGFGAKETVTVKWDCASASCASSTVLGTVQANANGDLGLGATIPTTTTLGTHTIGAKGGTTGAFVSTTYNVTS